MTHISNYLHSPVGSTILLSVKPKYADLIIAGSKRVELRRALPANSVGARVIYSSSPVQEIVAMVDVKDTIEADLSDLWMLAKNNGGGLTKTELQDYFRGKTTGYAMLLENVRIFEKPVNPRRLINGFTSPQSFRYLAAKELKKLEKLLKVGARK